LDPLNKAFRDGRRKQGAKAIKIAQKKKSATGDI
jgi:hypothetical protein